MPPALDTAAASGPPEVRAMPASMIGYLIPSNFVNGVVRGGGDDILSSRDEDKSTDQVKGKVEEENGLL